MDANTIYLRNQEKIIELTEQEDKLKKQIAAEAKKIAERWDTVRRSGGKTSFSETSD